MFQLSIKFPTNFPNDPPDIKFITKIYHPNISLDNGVICISTISSDWEKNPDIISVLYSIYDLLKIPNLNHGLNKEALTLYKNDPEQFKKKAKEFTKENALKLINS